MPVCEICNNRDFALIATRVREGESRILKCDNCGLIIQNSVQDKEQLKEYYEIEYQRTNSLVRGKIQTPLEHFNDRLKTIKPIFEQIRFLLTPESKVLEVGCGPGSLLSLIKPHVAKCIGVELYSPFVDFMKEHLAIEAYAEDINRLNLKDSFDLVISIATLDHLPTPYETLSSMKNLLSSSGKIYIEVPNCDEALNRFLPPVNRTKFNKFFWQRAHLFYFTKETIAALFKKAGLEIKITCRHDYTLKNFLNWYFLGKPQASLVTGMTDTNFFEGKSDFELRANRMFKAAEKEFKIIISETFRGESLCCTGWRSKR
ncbi:MAG: class I SAM-dependent methyltransferase [Candidatus Omnitrophica bacterium]|nr:class I SAM-dependent methyltransferase [Candidatus Omnitrophota bacterium]